MRRKRGIPITYLELIKHYSQKMMKNVRNLQIVACNLVTHTAWSIICIEIVKNRCILFYFILFDSGEGAPMCEGYWSAALNEHCLQGYGISIRLFVTIFLLR